MMRTISQRLLLIAAALVAAVVIFLLLPGGKKDDSRPARKDGGQSGQNSQDSRSDQETDPQAPEPEDYDTEAVMPRFSEIEYVRPDLETITEQYESLIEGLEGNTLPLKEALPLLEDCYALYDDFYTMDTVAELRYYHDITQSYYADETEWFLENEPEMDQLFEALCSASANCEIARDLDREFWGDWVVDAYQGQDNARLDKTYVNLARQENLILAEYRRATADPTVTWKGAERSYWELQEDDSLTDSEWNQVRDLYYDKYSPILGDIYIRLVGARQALAEYLGYDNYEDFAYEYLYSRDYTPDQAQVLLDSIRRELAPLYGELTLNPRWEELTYSRVGESENFRILKDAALEMGGTIANSFRDMERYELYDIGVSGKKGDLSYQCYLYKYDNPFIFVKTEGYSDDILKAGHEFGHFVDSWYNYDATSSHDLAEVFSQGMEYLLLSRVPEEYQQELTDYKLLDTVDTFTQQGSFAAFEHQVFARPAAEWTPEALEQLSLELAKEYGYFEEGKEDFYAKSWIDITHFFDSPFYVISYCTSNDAAFQLYELECAAEGTGLKVWNAMLPRDRDSFLETVVDQGGLEDPFAPDRMEQVAALLREKLG